MGQLIRQWLAPAGNSARAGSRQGAAARWRVVGVNVAAALHLAGCVRTCAADEMPAWIWIEGEHAAKAEVTRHPWWYDQVKKEQFSGGDFVSNWSDTTAGELVYRFSATQAGDHALWLRANPVQSKLRFSANGGPWMAVDFARGQRESVNVAADGKPDLRFLCWCQPGTVALKQGANEIRFRMESENHFHGIIDCLVLTRAPFQPSGTLKPDQVGQRLAELAKANQGWRPWTPKPDALGPSPIDLRPLNEPVAGAKGRIKVKDGRFVSGDGRPVRFWGVNGPPESVTGEDLRKGARMLAQRGVNLVRIHGAVFDGKTGAFKPAAARRIREVVAAMKQEGIYTHLSIYFPLWFTPGPGLEALRGYDGKSHPFAALYFNPGFRKIYQEWWRELLTGRDGNGPALVDEPSLLGIELVNEDSFFFWTFADKNLPAPQREMLEEAFARWAVARHGGIEAALRAWNGLRLPQDGPQRLGFRPLWNMFTERTPRDRDTAAFLFETQARFYQESIAHVRGLGHKGLVTASNWITANDEVFGPLEKASYACGDFIDRHGYFACLHEGDNAAWSIREGHVFAHRSALGFEPQEPGKPLEFSHPVFDLKINGLPSMISETTHCRPNRFRTEAPLLFAAYGALQGSDSIVHFALDSTDWAVKPGFFMQPWTLMTPAMAGQFPAAAAIYRLGLIDEGAMMARVSMSLDEAKALKGSPFARQANLDALRAADVEKRARAGGPPGIDPRVHLVGRTRLDFSDRPRPAEIRDLAPFVDEEKRTITSSTRQLTWDWGKRLLTIDSPRAQGLVGNLGAGGTARLGALSLESPLDLGAIIVVALDGKPLAESARMLVQVMTEEQPGEFATDDLGGGRFRITRLGKDPWLVREARGVLRLHRTDAARLKVTPLDENGQPLKPLTGGAAELRLRPEVVYYLIAAGP